jgi:hypothetical protein
VLKHRFLIVSLIFLFSLGGLLNTFAHCLLEKDLPTKSSDHIPSSITCLDHQEHPFLAQVGQRDKRIHFLKIENRPAVICHKALLSGGTFHLTALRSPASILFSSSVPIYQVKNVYRI